jgi:polyhydroxyalkanoate synthase
VFKIHLLTDTDVTFVLTSGGHNVGIVNPPGRPGSSYQLLTRKSDEKYLDPDTWQMHAPHYTGSWWPAWQSWLAQRSAARHEARQCGERLGNAPGSYVFQH